MKRRIPPQGGILRDTKQRDGPSGPSPLRFGNRRQVIGNRHQVIEIEDDGCKSQVTVVAADHSGHTPRHANPQKSAPRHGPCGHGPLRTMQNISSGRISCAHRTGPVTIKTTGAGPAPWAHSVRPDETGGREIASGRISCANGAGPGKIIQHAARMRLAFGRRVFVEFIFPDQLLSSV